MSFANALEVQIRLSQRQTATQIAEDLAVPLTDIQKIELVCRYLQGRDCEVLCGELGIPETELSELCDEFLEAKFTELWTSSHGEIAVSEEERIRSSVNLERGRSALNPNDTELQCFVKELFSLELAAKNKIVKSLASQDTALQARLQKVKEQDELDSIALSQADFDVTDPSSNWEGDEIPRRKTKTKKVRTSEDRYSILRQNGTNGHNYDIQTSQIIHQLEQWSKLCEFEITGAGHDWLQLRFKKLPQELAEFAESVYKFCPDAVDQGTQSVAALMDDIRQSRKLHLWWD